MGSYIVCFNNLLQTGQLSLKNLKATEPGALVVAAVDWFISEVHDLLHEVVFLVFVNCSEISSDVKFCEISSDVKCCEISSVCEMQ